MVKMCIASELQNPTNEFNLFSPENVKKLIQDKLTFIDYVTCKDIHDVIKNSFENKSIIDVGLSHYNEIYVTQAITNGVKTIFIKRKIIDGDTYTLEANDCYEYFDVSIDDIVNLYINTYTVSGLRINIDGSIDDMKFVIKNYDEYVGLLKFDDGKEIKFINVSNFVNKNAENQSAQIDEKIRQLVNAHCTEWLYTQTDIGFCILNFYYKVSNNEKNNMISKLISHDVGGEIILFIHDKINGTDMILNTSKQLFSKIYDIKTNEKKIKQTSKNFFNIFRDLLRS